MPDKSLSFMLGSVTASSKRMTTGMGVMPAPAPVPTYPPVKRRADTKDEAGRYSPARLPPARLGAKGVSWSIR